MGPAPSIFDDSHAVFAEDERCHSGAPSRSGMLTRLQTSAIDTLNLDTIAPP